MNPDEIRIRAREFDLWFTIRRAHENLEGRRGWKSGNVFFARAQGYPFEDSGPRAAREAPGISKSLRKCHGAGSEMFFIWANVFFLARARSKSERGPK